MFQLVRDLIAALNDLALAMQENSKTANAVRSDWAVIGRRITASEEMADKWYVLADSWFQRVVALEEGILRANNRIGKLEVELMKQSAKKPRKRKAKP